MYVDTFNVLISLLFRYKLITKSQDMIAKYEILSQTIYTLRKIGKLIISFVDMFKDIFFTYYVINALGGMTEIWKYPTQFNAVYVFLMVATLSLIHI